MLLLRAMAHAGAQAARAARRCGWAIGRDGAPGGACRGEEVLGAVRVAVCGGPVEVLRLSACIELRAARLRFVPLPDHQLG